MSRRIERVIVDECVGPATTAVTELRRQSGVARRNSCSSPSSIPASPMPRSSTSCSMPARAGGRPAGFTAPRCRCLRKTVKQLDLELISLQADPRQVRS